MTFRASTKRLTRSLSARGCRNAVSCRDVLCIRCFMHLMFRESCGSYSVEYFNCRGRSCFELLTAWIATKTPGQFTHSTSGDSLERCCLRLLRRSQLRSWPFDSRSCLGKSGNRHSASQLVDNRLWPIASSRCFSKFGRYWRHSGHRSAAG
jgi:hypothetical protein